MTTAAVMSLVLMMKMTKEVIERERDTGRQIPASSMTLSSRNSEREERYLCT